jgi:hypothetical protein
VGISLFGALSKIWQSLCAPNPERHLVFQDQELIITQQTGHSAGLIFAHHHLAHSDRPLPGNRKQAWVPSQSNFISGEKESSDPVYFFYYGALISTSIRSLFEENWLYAVKYSMRLNHSGSGLNFE